METQNLFCEGLAENNTAKLLSVPKSDIHIHSTKGCRRAWLEERIGRRLSPPPERFDGLAGMQAWFTGSIKPYCSGREGIVLRWEGAVAEAKRNHIARLAMNFGPEEIELAGGMETFRAIIESFYREEAGGGGGGRGDHLPRGLRLQAALDGDDQELPAARILQQDVREVGPGYGPALAEVSRRETETRGREKRGIHAASSGEVMRFLADNRIRLNVCPSSNVMLGYASGYRDHPVKLLYENGVPVTINTDDLLIFDSSIENEYLLLYRSGALTAGQLDEIRQDGLNPLPRQ